MPIGRYIAWVGMSLLALLFVADWYLPKSLPEAAGEPINQPVIRITSIQRAPERIVIDTSQPTIVPAPAPAVDAVQAEPSPLQSYASAVRPAAGIEVDKSQSVIKKPVNKVAGYRPQSANPPVASRGKSATTVRSTKLSFMDIISGKLARKLFNLH
jgi:hypothetical protein